MWEMVIFLLKDSKMCILVRIILFLFIFKIFVLLSNYWELF